MEGRGPVQPSCGRLRGRAWSPLSQIRPSQVVQPDLEEAGGFPGAGEGAHLCGGRREDAGEGPSPPSWGCPGHGRARPQQQPDPSLCGAGAEHMGVGGASVQQLAGASPRALADWNPVGTVLSQEAELACRWASPVPLPCTHHPPAWPSPAPRPGAMSPQPHRLLHPVGISCCCRRARPQHCPSRGRGPVSLVGATWSQVCCPAWALPRSCVLWPSQRPRQVQGRAWALSLPAPPSTAHGLLQA